MASSLYIIDIFMLCYGMTDFSNIKVIIWDMDQTLYPYWDDLAAYCHEATGFCALEMGVPLSQSEAEKLSRLSYAQRGLTTRLFKEQYGVDEIELFRVHHERMLDRLIEPSWQNHFVENPELAQLIKKGKDQGIRHVILTNGSRGWAEKLAEHVGIHDDMDVIMGADDINLRQKGTDGIVPFLSVLGKLGFQGSYEEVLVVEDSLKNMVDPNIYGMRTAWVRWGHPQNQAMSKPDYVDAVFDRPNDVIQSVLQSFPNQNISDGFNSLSKEEKPIPHKPLQKIAPNNKFKF